MSVSQDYCNNGIKLLAIARETNGWGFDRQEEIGSTYPWWSTYPWHNNTDKTINDLMGVYEKFQRGKDYKFRTAFCNPVNELHLKLNPGGQPYGFMWTNLVKVDQDQHRPDKIIEEDVSNSFPVLQSEIKILDPNVIVFFMGPKYIPRLKSVYKGIELETVAEFGPRERFPEGMLTKVFHTDLHVPVFRTYHPYYFIQSGMRNQFDQVISEIARIVHLRSGNQQHNQLPNPSFEETGVGQAEAVNVNLCPAILPALKDVLGDRLSKTTNGTARGRTGYYFSVGQNRYFCGVYFEPQPGLKNKTSFSHNFLYLNSEKGPCDAVIVQTSLAPSERMFPDEGHIYYGRHLSTIFYDSNLSEQIAEVKSFLQTALMVFGP